MIGSGSVGPAHVSLSRDHWSVFACLPLLAHYPEYYTSLVPSAHLFPSSYNWAEIVDPSEVVSSEVLFVLDQSTVGPGPWQDGLS